MLIAQMILTEIAQNTSIQRMILKFMISMVAISCGCHSNLTKISETRTIFKENDLEILSEKKLVFDQLAATMGSIGVWLPVEPKDSEEQFLFPYCSGFKISQNYVLTANHCIRPSMIYNPYFIADDIDLNNYQIVPFGTSLRLLYMGSYIKRYHFKKSSFQVTLAYQSKANDFAILQLVRPSPNPCANIHSFHDQRISSAVLYGYPNGMPLTVAKNCQVLAEDEAYFYHDCDSLGGSSGGLIAQGKKVFGMHLKGAGDNIYEYYQKYGTFEPLTYFKNANLGIKLHYIVRSLEMEKPDLWYKIKEDDCEKK